MAIAWQAVYSDATFLNQYNENGSENKYTDIDRVKLTEFRLFNSDTGDLRFSVMLEDGQRLVYRKRVFMKSDDQQILVYLVGWQMTVNGTNVQSIAYIPENGSSVVMGGKFKEGHALYGPIVYWDCELQEA